MGTRSGAGRRRTRAASLAARRIESECDALCVAEGDRADYLSARADEYDWRARAHAIAEEAGDDAGKLELAALAFDAALAARDAARSVCGILPDPAPHARRVAVRAYGGRRDYRDDRALALYGARATDLDAPVPAPSGLVSVRPSVSMTHGYVADPRLLEVPVFVAATRSDGAHFVRYLRPGDPCYPR